MTGSGVVYPQIRPQATTLAKTGDMLSANFGLAEVGRD
jgi:hypothetical protein